MLRIGVWVPPTKMAPETEFVKIFEKNKVEMDEKELWIEWGWCVRFLDVWHSFGEREKSQHARKSHENHEKRTPKWR